MSENTKETADAGSFGLKLHFHAPQGIGREELAELTVAVVRSMGTRVGQRKKYLLGHIKAFVTVPGGSLKVNMIDLDLGPEKEDELPSNTIEEGEARFMAAVIGLADDELEEILEESLAALEERLEVEVHEHKHEH